jgi:hypothetical protein
MKLIEVDSLTSDSTQAFIPYANSFVGNKYNIPYRLWINSGQCKVFANVAGVYEINPTTCTDTMYYVCEYSTPGELLTKFS